MALFFFIDGFAIRAEMERGGGGEGGGWGEGEEREEREVVAGEIAGFEEEEKV